MENDKSWELFFKTGLPEAYLLAKHRQKLQYGAESPSKTKTSEAHRP